MKERRFRNNIPFLYTEEGVKLVLNQDVANECVDFTQDYLVPLI